MILEKEEGREGRKEGEKERELYCLPPIRGPEWGLNVQSRYVP